MRRSPSSKRSGARSAGPTISICGRAGTGRLGASLSPAFIDLSPLPPSAVHRRAGGNVQTLIGSEPETAQPRLDRDLAAQFHDPVRDRDGVGVGTGGRVRVGLGLRRTIKKK